MIFKNITIVNENFEIESDCNVEIAGDRISRISKAGSESEDNEDTEVYSGKGKLLMSGFYNAHGHSPMTLLRGYGENMRLKDWLEKKIFPFEAELTGEDVYCGTMLAMAESFRYGIVSTSDMYYFCEHMAKAVKDAGGKANISRGIVNFSGEEPQKLEGLLEAKAFYENYHNTEDGRIRVDMSLHGEYTSDFATAEALADYSQNKDTIMHIHVSETKEEHEGCIKRHGMTPGAYLEKAGLFEVPALAAHCIYCTDEDLALFREKGVTVAVNPVSNMKLASGICDVGKIMDAGVGVALGTDSVASNNSLNFLEEMKFLALSSKIITKDPCGISPKDVLRIATRGGALAQGRRDCGLVKEGYKADLIVLDISRPNMNPAHDTINNLVYSVGGDEIEMTIIDGRIVYRKSSYPTMDTEKIIYMVNQSINGILEKLR